MSETDESAPAHVTPQGPSRPTERLWRVRKDSRTMEAFLGIHPDSSGDGVEVQFFYKGEFMYGRRWPTRALALAEADDRLQELQRDGWATHW